jgi:hypothetical protein
MLLSEQVTITQAIDNEDFVDLIGGLSSVNADILKELKTQIQKIRHRRELKTITAESKILVSSKSKFLPGKAGLEHNVSILRGSYL